MAEIKEIRFKLNAA